MNGQLGGSGVLIWVFGILYYATAALSLYITVDAIRRRATDYVGSPDGRWFYAVPQGLFVVAFLAGVVMPSIRNAGFGLVMLTAAPVAFAHQVAYLLRIVFPTRERREARSAAVAERSDRTAGGIDRSAGRGAEPPG
ncbi:MAG: hypothetical protein C0418_01735 [Coriobacteriaceae bacterium]|nr:hypothetical protein [Coriobacteriaceae bacterium]